MILLQQNRKTALQRHNTKIRNTYSQERNCGYSHNSYIYVCVSDLYTIPLIGLPILLQENKWAERGNISIAHRHMNVEIGIEAAAIPFLGIHKFKFLCSAILGIYKSLTSQYLMFM